MANLVAPTASWVSKPLIRSPVLVPRFAAEVEDADGFWGIEIGGVADGYSVTDGDGFEGIDTAAASGNTVRVLNGAEVVY